MATVDTLTGMPFTIVHAAAALPLKGLFPRRVSLTGLMAGAMAPDLIYFLTLTTVDRGFSHSWTGMVVFCLPAGVLFAYAFHRLIKGPLLLHLPSPWDRRLSGLAAGRFAPGNVEAWGVLLGSAAAGILTHYLWDSLAHGNGHVAGIIPLLRHEVEVLGRPVMVARVVQLGSNAAGFGALWWWLRSGRMLPRPKEDFVALKAGNKWRFWIGTGLFACALAGAALTVQAAYFPERIETPLITFGVAGFAGFFWGVAGATIAGRYRLNRGGPKLRSSIGRQASKSVT